MDRNLGLSRVCCQNKGNENKKLRYLKFIKRIFENSNVNTQFIATIWPEVTKYKTMCSRSCPCNIIIVSV